jgi:hypothetical protein
LPHYLLAKEITFINKRLFFPCLVLAVLHVPDRAYGRAYENTPVETNQLELGDAFISALEGRMEALVAMITAAIVGGTAVFCCTMYLTSGSESDRRSKRQI